MRGRGTGCNRGARGFQADSGPPSLSIEPCGGSNMHQLFGGSREGTYLLFLSLPSRLRVHPMSNVQLHHTSHSRYIRRHNVGVRAQHTSLPPGPPFLPPSHSCASRASFWIARKESFNCQSAGVSTERGREKEREILIFLNQETH